MWKNANYTLEPLAAVLKQLIKESSTVKRSDFEIHNHYARLAYEAGMQNAYQTILDMLPVSPTT